MGLVGGAFAMGDKQFGDTGPGSTDGIPLDAEDLEGSFDLQYVKKRKKDASFNDTFTCHNDRMVKMTTIRKGKKRPRRGNMHAFCVTL